MNCSPINQVSNVHASASGSPLAHPASQSGQAFRRSPPPSFIITGERVLDQRRAAAIGLRVLCAILAATRPKPFSCSARTPRPAWDWPSNAPPQSMPTAKLLP